MTIKEIAELAGVSTSTVSKIINNKDDSINPQTRERVLKVVKEYNYTPYANVKTSSKTFLIGVLLNGPSQTMLQGILEAAQAHDYSIVLFNSFASKSDELKHISALCRHGIDGLIWEPVDEDSKKHRSYFDNQDIPIVWLADKDHLDSYYIDFSSLGYYLTQQLLDYKHSSIACLTKPGSRRSEDVLVGFKQCLFDHQIAFSDDMVIPISDIAAAVPAIAKTLTGIVSTHFASALSLYQAIKQINYDTPEDLSIVSLRDDVRETLSYPSISALPIPYQEFGHHVCKQLIALCESSPTDTATAFQITPHLLDRSSLDVPPSLKTKKIIAVGAINIDTTLTVDELPLTGKTVLAASSMRALGGKGANQAVGAAKLAHEAVLFAKVGNDADSAMAINALNEEGVSVKAITRDLNEITGNAYIQLQKDGESTITVLPGANQSLSARDIRAGQRLFEHASHCLVSTEIPMDAVLEACTLARQHHVTTIIKPAAIHTVPAELFLLSDIFIPNESEALSLVPDKSMSIEKQAQYCRSQGARTVIITLGDKGCYLLSDEQTGYYPAAVFTPVDNSGAADAFISALAAYLADGYCLETSVRIANYAAGFCISRMGVTTALVDKMTLENHIRHMEADLI